MNKLHFPKRHSLYIRTGKAEYITLPEGLDIAYYKGGTAPTFLGFFFFFLNQAVDLSLNM